MLIVLAELYPWQGTIISTGKELNLTPIYVFTNLQKLGAWAHNRHDKYPWFMSGICLFIYDFENTIDKTNSPTKAKIVKLSIFDHSPGVYVHVKCQMWINFFFPPWP